MNEREFENRTRRLAVDFIELVESRREPKRLQLSVGKCFDQGTSIGANYRSACRGRSTADVIAKLRIVEEEADESIYWMELLIESEVPATTAVDRLLKAAKEVLAMTVASIRTLQREVILFGQSKI